MERYNDKSFFAMLSRMKYIKRWALMRNSSSENVCEHSLETAVIAHALAVIGNCRLEKKYNAEHIVLIALYHDCTEIITGDMPTPVKYYNADIKDAYKEIEENAAKNLLKRLPGDMVCEYEQYLLPKEEDAVMKIVKAADKISALIKCIEEKKTGNMEFVHAEKSTYRAIMELGCEEAVIFCEEFLPEYEKTLDELSF